MAAAQCKLHIIYEKPFYTPGDQINGKVYVDVFQTIETSELHLKIKGKEKARTISLQTMGGSNVKYATDDKKEYFKYKYNLFDFNDGYVHPGQYEFPFSFKLPQDLPNSFEHNWEEHGTNCYAKIFYEIKAE